MVCLSGQKPSLAPVKARRCVGLGMEAGGETMARVRQVGLEMCALDTLGKTGQCSQACPCFTYTLPAQWLPTLRAWV